MSDGKDNDSTGGSPLFSEQDESRENVREDSPLFPDQEESIDHSKEELVVSVQPKELSQDESEWKDDDFLSFGDALQKNDEASQNNQEQGVVRNEELTSTSTNSLNLGRELAPWMTSAPAMWMNPLVRLHNEIIQFTELIEPTPRETQERNDIVELLRELVNRTFQNSKMHVFGSLATGVFLPTSDIDIVIVTSDNASDPDSKEKNAEKDNTNDNQAHLLHKLANELRNEWLKDLSYLEVIENTRVPLVKLTHHPTNLNIDVSFNQDRGPDAAKLVVNYLQAFPPLRHLTFVLKYFLSIRALNEPYTGGVGSYLLQLMIVAFLVQREREAATFRRPLSYNLGALLLEFFEFYGTDFNYITTGISLNKTGGALFFSKGDPTRRDVFLKPDRLFMLALENPLDPTLDVGSGSFRIQMVQRAFATAHKLLLAHLTVPELLPTTTSILATILPPSEMLYERSKKLSEEKSYRGRTKIFNSRDKDVRTRRRNPKDLKRKRQE